MKKLRQLDIIEDRITKIEKKRDSDRKEILQFFINKEADLGRWADGTLRRASFSCEFRRQTWRAVGRFCRAALRQLIHLNNILVISASLLFQTVNFNNSMANSNAALFRDAAAHERANYAILDRESKLVTQIRPLDDDRHDWRTRNHVQSDASFWFNSLDNWK